MKTWIFDEDALNTAIATWVEQQVASGHPKAVTNAAFVGRAIKDMLETSPKLFKVSKPVEESSAKFVSSKLPTIDEAPVTTKSETAPNQPQGGFTLKDMKWD